MGYEIAPTTKTPHIQGYLEFHKPVGCLKCALAHISKMWCRPARGTFQQASDYCKKGGHFDEYKVDYFIERLYHETLDELKASAAVPISWYLYKDFSLDQLPQIRAIVARELVEKKYGSLEQYKMRVEWETNNL